MNIWSIYNTKSKCLKTIYFHYLRGYTIQDIYFIVNKKYKSNLNPDEVNDIIDYMNYINT